MKKQFYTFLLGLPMMMVIGCHPRILPKHSSAKLDRTEIIVRLEPTTLSTQTNNLLTDDELSDFIQWMFGQVATIDSCNCADDRIKIVRFSEKISKGKLLTAVNRIKDNSNDGVEGDFQLIFKLPKTKKIPGSAQIQNLDPYVSSSNPNVVVAVLDSGIDLNHFPNAGQFLFQNPQIDKCTPSGSAGWNFVIGSNNIFDNTNSRHGTKVIKLITDNIDLQSSSIQILPLKIADDDGKIAYGDIVCAMSYIKQVNISTGGKIKVVNASFGLGYRLNNEMRIFRDLIDDVKSDALLVASAGNDGKDNDAGFLDQHAPSGFDNSNIVGVGGHDRLSSAAPKIHIDSNYGTISIDIAAPYEHNVLTATDAGTSFSAAYVSGMLATEFLQHFSTKSVSQIKADFLAGQSISTPLQSKIKGGKFVE